MKLRVQRSSPLGRQRAAVIELGERLLPTSGDIDGFVDAVSGHRRRPLRVMDYPLDPAGPSGLWISTPAADYIVCAASATPTRRAAIVCHELAHMLLGHEPEVGQAEAVQAVAQILAPDVDPSVVSRFLTRHRYEASAERDAEAVATAFVTAAASRQRVAATATDRVSERLR